MTQTDRKKVALVLGGGSARGLAHIGVLKVLQQNNIPIDFVVGTSIGALIGAMYCLELPMQKAQEIALKTTWWQLADFVISATGFLEGKNLEKIIVEALDNKGFADLKTPLAVVATDIENGEEVVITEGDLVRVIRASCSIPGIFLPVRVNERLLVDGGLKNTVPSSVAKKLGADFIIAVDVGYCIRKGRITNIFQVVFQSIQILGDELNKCQVKEADIVIDVQLGGDIDQMAFDKAADIIACGEKTAQEAMPALLAQFKNDGYI
jgi:NTE family protein